MRGPLLAVLVLLVYVVNVRALLLPNNPVIGIVSLPTSQCSDPSLGAPASRTSSSPYLAPARCPHLTAASHTL